MFNLHLSSLAVMLNLAVPRDLLRWMARLGGPGLILLGLLDNSVVPVPGSMDALTIVLSAHQREWWPYYALMATAGSVIGGYLTYRLARKGGKETLARKLSRANMEKANKLFERRGFGAIAIPALLPPPAPMVPFLLAAGTMQYPLKNFLAALALGRIVRYSILAFLGARYGRRIITSFLQYGHPILLVSIVVTIALGVVFLVFVVRRLRRKTQQRA
ncbi:MAG: VTT domain-containing protein [Candidatus Acidiferrales bacterium]